jgi:hypothetical protein
VSGYEVLKFLHIASVIGWIGGAVALTVLQAGLRGAGGSRLPHGSRPPDGNDGQGLLWPWRMPYWLVNLGASYVALAFGGGRLPISNAKPKSELGWSPRLRTYREALGPLGDGPAR